VFKYCKILLKIILAKVERFEDLICWQEARNLVRIVYEASNEGPMAKDFDMRSQIRRAAMSTMNNIAEGFGRYSKKEFIRFLEISSASASEVKSVSYAALDLSYWNQETVTTIQSKAESVKALDLGLIKYLSGKK
jgi:four helix bundle protein